MAEKNKYEAGFESNALKAPQRIVFVTKKTSAKVVGEPAKQLMSYPHLILREAIAFMVLMIVVVIALVVIPYFNINIRGEPLWAANGPQRLRLVVAVLVVLVVFLALFHAW